MRHVYPKDGRLYLRVKVAGKWKGIPTDFKPGQERQARALLDRLLVKLEAGKDIAGDAGPVTLARWSAAWVKERAATISTWKNDESVMRLHVLPTLGAMRLDEVRPLHLVNLVKQMRKTLAPKSVHNAYSTVSAMFRDACIADLLPMSASPCILTKHQLGPKTDADPEWRVTALYSLDELETLISDERVPMDRRVLYALEGVAALRHGEAAGLRWRNCGVQPEHPPLGMLYVACSYDKPFPKGDVCRPVPIHPTLAAILAEWRLYGWARMMGRQPGPDDLVVPLPLDFAVRPGDMRRKWNSRDGLEVDLKALGFRHRRGHDLRRTFISRARSDGARSDILRRVTHKPPKEVIEGYTTFEWDVVCAEVLKLKVTRRHAGKVFSIPRAIAVGAGLVATPLATPENQPMAVITKSGEPTPGLEPGSSSANHGATAPSTKQPGNIPQAYIGPHGGIDAGRSGTATDARSTVATRLLVIREEWVQTGDEAALRRALLELLAGVGGVQ